MALLPPELRYLGTGRGVYAGALRTMRRFGASAFGDQGRNRGRDPQGPQAQVRYDQGQGRPSLASRAARHARQDGSLLSRAQGSFSPKRQSTVIKGPPVKETQAGAAYANRPPAKRK